MSEAMTNQLTQSLKGYFRNEEYSDKVLHIIEMEVAVKLPMNLKDDLEGLDEDGDDSSDEDSCSDKSKLNAPGRQSDADGLPVVESDSDEVKSDLVELNDTSTTDGSREENSGSIPNDEIPKKVFHQCSFFMSKTILGYDVEKLKNLVQDNGGDFINVIENATYIISHYLLPKEKKIADAKERTIQWIEDCIKGNEIILSLVNVLYRPISVESKPLSNLILTFGKCEEKEKDLLRQVVERLGASYQNLIFTRQNNNIMIASSHFLICCQDQSDSTQFNTAVKWSIPCVTKQWLWKCSETLEKVDETNFTIEHINFTNNAGTNMNGTGNDTTMNETGNGHVYSVFPVHSLLLSINSKYFKALTSDSGMRESNSKNIAVRVNPGEGSYLEILIHSIYNQDILNELTIVDFLKVLELADQFLCDQLIEYGLKVLETLSIQTLPECNQLIEQVQIFKSLSSVCSNEIYASITDLCASYLAEYFYSLECCPEKQNDFNTMPFVSISVLLESGLSFLHHENSVIYFLVTWLSIDGERQTEYNIKKLLRKVRYEHITVGYFNDFILKNKVLSKWTGFYKWCANALLYHGFSDEDKSLIGLHCSYLNRSIYSLKIQNSTVKLEYSDESVFEQPKVSTAKVIYQGYIFTPLITFVKNDSCTYDLILNLYCDDEATEKEKNNFYLKFGIALGVFPDIESHETMKRFYVLSKSFVRVHFRRFKVEYVKRNSFEKSIGTIDEELLKKFKDGGINVSIIFQGLELSDWPASINILTNVKEREIHRKSTFNFNTNRDEKSPNLLRPNRVDYDLIGTDKYF